jgi:hypothetical protein
VRAQAPAVTAAASDAARLPDAANDTATMIPMARGDATQEPADMIGVTLSRETATFSVPVSEASLPQSLQAALAGISGASHASPTVALAANDGHSEHGFADFDLETTKDIELSPHEMAVIGRMAPEAAE